MAQPVERSPHSTGDLGVATCRVGEIEIVSLQASRTGTLMPLAFRAGEQLLAVIGLTATGRAAGQTDGPSEGRAEGRLMACGQSHGRNIAIYDLSQGWRGLFAAPFHCLCLRIPSAMLGGTLRRAKRAKPAAEGFQDPIFWHLGAVLLAVLKQPGPLPNASAMAQGVMAALLAQLRTVLGPVFQHERPVQDVVRGGLAPWQERRAKTLLIEDMEEGVSLDTIAKACGLSLSYFAKAFKQSVGQPPLRWLAGQRVERAKTLLLEDSAPLAQIAAACGYADQSHFTRAFNQATGRTPGRWRRLSHSAVQDGNGERALSFDGATAT